MGGGQEEAEFEISLTPRAYRSLARLLKANESLAKRISRKIDSLSQQPMQGKLLAGTLKGNRSLRVGRYRIIYRVDVARRSIMVVNIGHRREIYSY